MTTRPEIYDGVPTWLGVAAARAPADLAGADAVIIGVPYMSPMFGFDADLTPRNVRKASTRYAGGYLPEYDIDVLNELRVVDYGDAPIFPDDVPAAVASVRAKAGEALAAGAIPITLGGSAPASGYACAAAIADHLGGAPVGVINLDAHGDSRDSWQGSSELQAGTWVRHLHRLPGFSLPRHMQIGLRGPGNPKPAVAWYRDNGAGLYTGKQVAELGIDHLTREAISRAGAGAAGIWLGIDWDVLDMSVTPEWVYPEPYGLATADLLRLVFEVGRKGCLGASTMSGPAHAATMHWITTWTLLHLLAGVAAAKREDANR